VAGNEVGQQRHGGPHSKKTLWTEESIGTASGLWLQTGTDGELTAHCPDKDWRI